jgi:HNH endonuclease
VSRQPVDSWYWSLLLEACGNKCGCCGKHQSELRQPLQRGHIKLHSSGGDDEPENIMPVCPPCNKEHTKSDTPFNHLPADYLTRLAVLLLRRINPKISCLPDKSSRRVILTNEVTENTRVIDWQTGDFGVRTDVYTRSQHASPHAVNQAIEQLVSESRMHPNPPNYPNPGRKVSMREFVRDYGAEVFLEVGRMFLAKEMWITPDDRFMSDSWSQFVDGFRDLYARWRRAEVERADNRKRQAEEQKLADEYAKAKQQQTIWDDYLLAVETPDWPGMPDADREFKQGVFAESEKLRERAIGVLRRYKLHYSDELLAEKKRLLAMVVLCKTWALRCSKKDQEAHAVTLKDIREWIEREKSVEKLRTESYTLQYLHDDLNPDRPPSDPEIF